MKRSALSKRFRLVWLVSLLQAVVGLGHAKADDDQRLVLVAAESAPTAYMENGQLTGILVDIMTEAFSRTDYEIVIKLKPWARCLFEVREGIVDGIFSAYRLPEREEFLTYTEQPVITQVQSLFVRADSAFIYSGDVSSLDDLKIGIIGGTSYGPRTRQTRRSETFIWLRTRSMQARRREGLRSFPLRPRT